jgi:hypothetical protein
MAAKLTILTHKIAIHLHLVAESCTLHPRIVRAIKSRRMRWAVHVARMGEGRGVYRFWLGGQKGRDHWEDLGAGRRIILIWSLERELSMGRTGFGWFRIRSSGGLL